MKTLASSLETMLKLAGALAVIGYISLRAHLNYLGISNAMPLSTERYLMEVYHWVMTTVPPLLSGAVLLGALVYLLVRLWRWCCSAITPGESQTPKSDPRNPTRFSKWQQFKKQSLRSCLDLPTEWKRSHGVARIAFFTGIAFLLAGNALKPSPSTDILMGDLMAENIPGDILRVLQLGYYWVLCMGCVALGTYLRYSSLRGTLAKNTQRRLLRAGTYAAFILMLVWVPLFFGQTAHSFHYPKTTVTTKKGTVTGYLMLETGDAITLWTVESAHGQSVQLPREEIISVSVGKMTNLLELAASESGKSAAPASGPAGLPEPGMPPTQTPPTATP